MNHAHAPDMPELRHILRGETLFALLVILAILFGYRQELEHDPTIAMSEDRGYRSAANLLVENNCLELRTLPGSIGRLTIEPAVGKPGCPAPEIFDKYRKNAPINGDMQGLIEQRWQIGEVDGADRLLAIRPSSHELRFSGADEEIWAGSVTYASGEGVGAGQQNWWVSGDDIRRQAPNCSSMLVDGKPPEGAPSLYQYVQCDGRAWQSVEPIEAISEEESSARRVRDPSLASVLRRLEASSIEERRLESTIQRDLHLAMQRRLEDHLNGANMAGKREQTIRAGVLLMDGLTGEIAAAATYPLRAEHSKGDRGEAWRALNWNFQRLPVGSTAKVPFAAAIIQTDPSLASSSPRSVSTDYCPSGDRGNTCRVLATRGLGLTFEQFITRSNNAHALWLLDRAYRSEQTQWMDNLRRFACIEPLDLEGDASCSGYLWRKDSGSQEERTRGRGEPLLRLEMNDLRGESLFAAVYLDILGGNRSSWTSANLAQSYARIFSDKPVNPRLTIDDAGQLPRLGVERDVWRRIRDGMAGVLINGTGRSLCSEIECEENRLGNVWLFAKTGTPTIADVAPVSEDAEGDNGKVLVLLAAKTANNRPPQSAADLIDLKVIVITQRYSARGRNATDLAARLFEDRQFRVWLGSSSRNSRGAQP